MEGTLFNNKSLKHFLKFLSKYMSNNISDDERCYFLLFGGIPNNFLFFIVLSYTSLAQQLVSLLFNFLCNVLLRVILSYFYGSFG